MISGRFIKSSILYSVGGTLPMASGFILLPFYTSALTIAQFAWLGIYISISLLLQVVVSYSTDTFLGVNYLKVKDNKDDSDKMLHQIFSFILAAGVIFLLLSFFIGDWTFSNWIDRSGNVVFYNYGWMTVLTAICNGFFKTYTNYHVYTQRVWRYFYLNLANFFLTIIISIIGLKLSPGTLDGPIYGRLLSGAGIFIICLFFLIRENRFRFNFSLPEGFHKFCFPYMVYLLMIWIVANIDRFIINNNLDSNTLGVYDFALKCVILIEFVQGGIAAAFYPEIFAIWRKSGKEETTKESNKYFNTFSSINIFIAAAMTIGLPLVLPWVIPNKEYHESFAIMGILIASYVTRALYHYFLTPLLYLQKTSVLPKVFGITAIMQIAGTYFFIDVWGIKGVIVMAVLIKIAQVVFLWLFARKHFVFSMNPVKMILLPGLYILSVFIIWLINPETFSFLWAILVFVTFTVLIAIMYKKELQFFYMKIMSKVKSGKPNSTNE
ncbi:MAG: lipopolysaccharide biosynthesis protein [Bacteroidia bacterium]